MKLKRYEPAYVGTVTKYVFVDSPDTTPEALVIRAYEISEGVMIKETCFGLQVTGTPDEVNRVIKELRKVDRSHIFVKDRGFPPGDPRRCRANLGGARPGYYGHEFEIGLIRYISHAIEVVEEGDPSSLLKPEHEREAKAGLDIKRLRELIEEEER